jgi:hypothetical protein
VSEARYDELCHTVAKLWGEVWRCARLGPNRQRRGRLLHIIMKIEHRLAHESTRLAG